MVSKVVSISCYSDTDQAFPVSGTGTGQGWRRQTPTHEAEVAVEQSDAKSPLCTEGEEECLSALGRGGFYSLFLEVG